MNSFWNLFTSVKLAIVTLCIIAVTSVLGTIIPQGNSFEWYVNFFSNISFAGTKLGTDIGHKLALITDLLDIHTMYSSWWFVSLLSILSLNLIICSLDRIPTVFKQIKMDNLSFSLNRLEKMKQQHQFTCPQTTVPECLQQIEQALARNGWKAQSSQGDPSLVFSQKSPWSRMGVYVVHLSILVIFAGALVGSMFGFKASVMLPETKETATVYETSTSKPLDLGFTVRCDFFQLDYYKNGMPKEYKSGLTVSENGQIVKQTEIEVNKPLKYKGITFYQASYEPYQDFILTVQKDDTSGPNNFLAPFQKQIQWEDANLTFGIINAEAMNNRLARVKLWVSDNINEPVSFWTNPNLETTITIGGKEYTFKVKQLFATGLQVAKDPGVWLVYLGCFLMLGGLYASFFMSHKRIWVVVKKSQDNMAITVYGSVNKNELGFNSTFDSLSGKIQDSLNS